MFFFPIPVYQSMYKPVCQNTKQKYSFTSPWREKNSYKWVLLYIHICVCAWTSRHIQPCSKDEECCLDQTCVWGQCTVNATSGTEGTICQGQSDCRSDLCCAFQPGEPSIDVHGCVLWRKVTKKQTSNVPCGYGLFCLELLFPVCNPRPGKGESCRNHPNLLMDMLAWDQDGPQDHCPCADGLLCQPHG